MSEENKRDWSRVKRTSNKQISFRANEEEAELVKLLADQAQMSVAAYVRNRALTGEIKRPLMSQEDSQKIVQTLFAIEKELGKQGNNLNQLTKSLNGLSAWEISPDKKEKTQNEVESLLKGHEDVLKYLQGIWFKMS